MLEKQHLIIVGTKPGAGKGGISTALEGYIQGAEQLEIPYSVIVTHIGSESSLTGVSRWFGQLKQLYRLIKRINNKGEQAIVWIHPAAWLSSIRKVTFALIAKLFKARVIIHIHSHSTERYLNHPILQLIPRAMLYLADEIFALTPWWKSRLEKVVPDKTITVVPNPISNALADRLNRHKDSVKGAESVVKIVAMSRLVSGKGFEKVIQALPELEEHYHLFIAGEGPIRAELLALASQLGVASRVHFTGWLAAEEKFEFLSNADVFCLPSRNDSFGMVFIEAMVCHLPVVALNFGGVADVVKHHRSGILLEDDNAKTIVEGVLLALAHKNELATGGAQHVKEHYFPVTVANTVKQRMEALKDEQ